MKIYLTILLLLLILPVLVFAANVDTSGGLNVNVAGITVAVSGAFNSITTNGDNADDFSVTLGDAALTITSTDRRITSGSVPSSANYVTESVCGTDSSYIIIRGIVDTSITVTPISSACSTSGGGGGSVSVGGGGGGYSAPSVPAQTSQAATIAVTAVTPAVSTAPTSAAEGGVGVPTVSVGISSVFTKTFKLGMASSDVKRLQQLLNSDPDTKIAETGIGSSGNETEYFGSLTVKAIQKFQKKHGIVSSGTPETTGYGALGPKTRAKLAEVFATTSSTVPTATPAALPTVSVGISPVFTIGLAKGMTNSDIKRLQQILNSDSDTKITESGVGSPGNETEYFGSLTEKAIQKFQKKYGIAKEGDSGYGYVGPKTRAKIQEAFSQGETSQAIPETAPVVPVTTTPASTSAAPVSQPAATTPAPAATQTTTIPDFLKMTPAPVPR